ncbi:hypothetical protein B0J11DRAFT_603659, partial [Dendryphion nanum]
MTTVHHTPPPGTAPFSIYEDPEDREPPSPSEVYEGDTSFASELSLPDADEAIPSIEDTEDEHEVQSDEQPEPYKSSYTSRPSNLSSRRLSAMTGVSIISALPSEISIATRPTPESRYTPRKDRPPFRNPSSVRAMQMSSPPPFATYDGQRERSKGIYKLATPSRSGRSETPVSISASGSRRSGSRRAADEHQSARPTPTPQHLPLVLLHVTLLPMQFPYSQDLMVKIMPDWLISNYKLLEDKLQDIVLMRRGLLIPHPRDEYELLEERILESLELKTPRLLKCGHFVAPQDSDDDQSSDDDDTYAHSTTDDGAGRGSRMSGGTLTVDEDGELKSYPNSEVASPSVCTDCHRQVKKPGNGVGMGSKRWDLRLYAANGLMRAGAWSAAWSEMERCDVEISPWIPDTMRRELDKRVKEEQEAERTKQLYQAELQRRADEDVLRLRELERVAEEKKKLEEAAIQEQVELEMKERQRKLDDEEAAKQRLEATLEERLEEAKEAIRLQFEAQSLLEADSVAGRFRALEEKLKNEVSRSRSISRMRPIDDIPLGTLLRNYLVLLAQDPRNVFIVVLSAVAIFLATHMDASPLIQVPASSLPSVLPEHRLPDSVPSISSIYVTSTTTATAISISTSIETTTV